MFLGICMEGDNDCEMYNGAGGGNCIYVRVLMGSSISTAVNQGINEILSGKLIDCKDRHAVSRPGIFIVKIKALSNLVILMNYQIIYGLSKKFDSRVIILVYNIVVIICNWFSS